MELFFVIFIIIEKVHPNNIKARETRTITHTHTRQDIQRAQNSPMAGEHK